MTVAGTAQDFHLIPSLPHPQGRGITKSGCKGTQKLGVSMKELKGKAPPLTIFIAQNFCLSMSSTVSFLPFSATEKKFDLYG
jgi:hypothetical protein